MATANAYEKATFILLLVLAILSLAIFVRVNSIGTGSATVVGKASSVTPADIPEDFYSNVYSIPDECLAEDAPKECDDIIPPPTADRSFAIVERDDVIDYTN